MCVCVCLSASLWLLTFAPRSADSSQMQAAAGNQNADASRCLGLYRCYRVVYSLFAVVGIVTAARLSYDLQHLHGIGGGQMCSGVVFCGLSPTANSLCRIGSEADGDPNTSAQGVVTGVRKYSVDCDASAIMCDVVKSTIPSPANTTIPPPGRCAGVCSSIEVANHSAPYVVPSVTGDETQQIIDPFAACACPFDPNRFLHCREHDFLLDAYALALESFIFGVAVISSLCLTSLFASSDVRWVSVHQRVPVHFCCVCYAQHFNHIPAMWDCQLPLGSEYDRTVQTTLVAPRYAAVPDVLWFCGTQLFQLIAVGMAWNYFDRSTDPSATAVTRRGLEPDRVVRASPHHCIWPVSCSLMRTALILCP